MERTTLLWLACAAALAGCRGHPTTGAAAPGVTAPPVQGRAPAQAQPPGARGPAPAVRVQGAAAYDQSVAIIVQNHAAEAVELAANVEVERKDGAGFQAFPQQGLALRAERLPAGGCVRLASGAELRPSPWQSVKAGADHGTYRFVLRGCDGSYRVEGEPFEVK